MKNNLSDKQIFEKLRLWRNDLAKKKHIKPFMIFPNDTLERTAKARPEKIEDLYGIKGWGPTKISRYGEKILKVIKNKKVNDLKKEVVSVKVFLGLMNRKLAEMSQVKVQGEISDPSLRERYAFFSLKDTDMEDYLVNCFLGWDTFKELKDLIEEGFEVIISGFPRIYKNGKLSLQVENIKPVGQGALKRAFEALKKKLKEKGYFAPERKKEIPAFVQNIGLITSSKSAAIKDFKQNLGNHGFNVFLKDVSVEGENAIGDIVSAIDYFNKEKPDLDLLILIRGGGSLESLKAFNSEKVAQSIIRSGLPVVTGVGHERDKTIAGFVSDKMLSTPTAVANFLDENHQKLKDVLESNIFNLNQNMKVFLKTRQKHQIKLSDNLFQVFSHFLDRYSFSLSHFTEKLFNGLRSVFQKFQGLENQFINSFNVYEKRINQKKHKLDFSFNKLTNSFKDISQEFKKQLMVNSNNLNNSNPLSILKRGYSITYKNKKPVKDVKQVKKGDLINTKLYKGEIKSKVK